MRDGEGGEIRIDLSRAELIAVREALELTPRFDGRPQVRDTLRAAVRARDGRIVLEHAVAERFARRLIAVDMPTALAKTRLLLAIQDSRPKMPRTGAERSARAA